MRKHYEKPEIVFMQLRPEEKLAACRWDVGFTTSGGNTCTKTFQQMTGTMYTLCMADYNNAAVSGS